MGGGIDGEGGLLMCMSSPLSHLHSADLLTSRLDDQPQADLLAMLLRVRPPSQEVRRWRGAN